MCCNERDILKFEILKEKLTKMLERIVKLVHIQDSIYIKDIYATENALYVDTCLLGPQKKTRKGKEVPSYPVIVLQITEMGLPVVFK